MSKRSSSEPNRSCLLWQNAPNAIWSIFGIPASRSKLERPAARQVTASSVNPFCNISCEETAPTILQLGIYTVYTYCPYEPFLRIIGSNALVGPNLTRQTRQMPETKIFRATNLLFFPYFGCPNGKKSNSKIMLPHLPKKWKRLHF